MTFKHTLQSFLTRSVLIKIMLFLIIIFTTAILYLDQQSPQYYNINQISNLTLQTPVQVKGVIHPLYETPQFSVVKIQNATQPHQKVTAILQTNSSKFKANTQYQIQGVVRIYEGEKQIEIYSIKTAK